MSLTTPITNKLLDHVLRGVAYAMPAQVHLGLLTTVENDGASFSEVSASDYQRQPVTFDAAAGRRTTLSSSATFPSPATDWGWVAAIGVFSAQAEGELLAYRSLAVDRFVPTDSVVTIGASDLAIVLPDVLGSGITTTLANRLLDHVFRGDPMAANTPYIAWLTRLEADDDFDEIADSGYSRHAVSCSAASSARISNDQPVETGPFNMDQSVSAIAILDAESSGTMLFHHTYPSPITVRAGQHARVATEQLTVTFD